MQSAAKHMTDRCHINISSQSTISTDEDTEAQRHIAICPRSQSKFRVESGLDSTASGLKLAPLPEPCGGIQRREY